MLPFAARDKLGNFLHVFPYNGVPGPASYLVLETDSDAPVYEGGLVSRYLAVGRSVPISEKLLQF